MKRNKIRANVMTEWDAKARRTKFAPGEIVQIQSAHISESNLLKERAKRKEVGRVFAVSCTNVIGEDGYNLIRTWDTYNGYRGYTRYYVEFADGECFGVQSQYLTKEPDIEFGDWK